MVEQTKRTLLHSLLHLVWVNGTSPMPDFSVVAGEESAAWFHQKSGER